MSASGGTPHRVISPLLRSALEHRLPPGSYYANARLADLTVALPRPELLGLLRWMSANASGAERAAARVVLDELDDLPVDDVALDQDLRGLAQLTRRPSPQPSEPLDGGCEVIA